MSRVLVKFSVNWADEFQCEEFCVMTEISFASLLFAYQKLFDDGPIEVYFGTNEYHTFNDIQEVVKCFTVNAITDEEAAVFDKYFKGSFGTSGIFNL